MAEKGATYAAAHIARNRLPGVAGQTGGGCLRLWGGESGRWRGPLSLIWEEGLDVAVVGMADRRPRIWAGWRDFGSVVLTGISVCYWERLVTQGIDEGASSSMRTLRLPCRRKPNSEEELEVFVRLKRITLRRSYVYRSFPSPVQHSKLLLTLLLCYRGGGVLATARRLGARSVERVLVGDRQKGCR